MIQKTLIVFIEDCPFLTLWWNYGNFSSQDSFKNDAFVYFLFRPTRVTFQRIFSLGVPYLIIEICESI